MRSRRCAGCVPRVSPSSLFWPGRPTPTIPIRSMTERWRRSPSQPGVIWLGRVEDVREVWQAAAIAVLPSTYGEGLPKSLLEAASCGRAIVASDMPGCREIVRPGGPGEEPGEETGLLVPPGDVTALSEAIAALARDPERRRAMGRAGRLLVERDFAEERIAAQTLALYESALSENGRRECILGKPGAAR